MEMGSKFGQMETNMEDTGSLIRFKAILPITALKLAKQNKASLSITNLLKALQMSKV